MNNKIKITESPREAFQAYKDFLPADKKAEYINVLLKAGFDIIDVGSFVSPKAVPKLKDTAEVIEKLDLSNTDTKILTSVGNIRGAENAVVFDEINYIGFLYSVSPAFLKLNINSTPEQALITMENIYDLCIKNNKIPVVDLCLAFGNPYGDAFSTDDVLVAVEKIRDKGIKKIVLADTLACGDDTIIEKVFKLCINQFHDIEFGFHLHTEHSSWEQKTDAAYKAGCRSFDSVLLGLGGCPMSGKEMISNLSTENLVLYCKKNNLKTNIIESCYNDALYMANNLFK